MTNNVVDLDAARQKVMADAVSRMPREPELPLNFGDGDGTSGGMDKGYIDARIEAVEARTDLKFGQLMAEIKRLPTKDDLWSWKVQWLAILVAAFALIVGSIIGGLSWLRPDPAQPPPVHVTISQPATPATVPAKP